MIGTKHLAHASLTAMGCVSLMGVLGVWLAVGPVDAPNVPSTAFQLAEAELTSGLEMLVIVDTCLLPEMDSTLSVRLIGDHKKYNLFLREIDTGQPCTKETLVTKVPSAIAPGTYAVTATAQYSVNRLRRVARTSHVGYLMIK